MSFKIRNTLIMLCMLIVVSASGLYVISFDLSEQTKAVEKELDTKKSELLQLRTINSNFSEKEIELDETKNMWNTFPKKLLREESSVTSYAYFNALASMADSKLNFNFRSSRKVKKISDTLIENTYTMNGTAKFHHLYRFLWKLENYPDLYKVGELRVLPEDDKKNASLHDVKFNMTLIAFSKNDIDIEENEPSSIPRLDVPKVNPFYPLVKKVLPGNISQKLNVIDARLLAVTQNTAYVSDRSGKTWELRKNSKVYLGELTNLDPTNGLVEFTLNEGGFLKKVKLKTKK